MAEHAGTAQQWADKIAYFIKMAEADGWVIGISDNGERYHLSVYTYEDLTNYAEVEW